MCVIMVNKNKCKCCVMGCYSDYDGETAGPPFSCLTKNENFKNKWIILIDKKSSDLFYVSTTLKRSFKKMARK